MNFSTRFLLIFFASLLIIIKNATQQAQPELYVKDNDIFFKLPNKNSIHFQSEQFLINGIDIIPALKNMTKANKIIQDYQLIISQYSDKIDNNNNNNNNAYKTPSDFPLMPVNTTGMALQMRALENRINTVSKQINLLRLLLNVDDCKSNPCKHGAICIDMFNGFLCECPNGWQGPTCEEDINECSRFAGTDLGCQNGGICMNLQGSYQCACINTWIGLHCTRKAIDCNSGGSEICGHGTCIAQNNAIGYKCLCDAGWTTNEKELACNIDVDECNAKHPACSKNPLVECVNLPGSFMCQQCPQGYTGNGYYCADINECELFNGGCSINAECINTMGSRKCGSCFAGYEGDGVICIYKGVCNVNNGGCNSLARCISNPAISATFVQCICQNGYTGSGIGPAGCTATTASSSSSAVVPVFGIISSCSPNPCAHGRCEFNNVTKIYSCVCDQFFIGFYCEQSFNPCQPVNPCRNGGICSVRNSAIFCTCSSGFLGRLCQKEKRSCGETIHGDNGTIKYPPNDFISKRLGGITCPWAFVTDEEKVLQVNITHFNLEHEPCISQWFQIHDGLNSLAPALGRFCGNRLPLNGTFTTTSNSVYLWLQSSGNNVIKPEVELTWMSKNPECGGTLLDEGVGMITSPGWPSAYPNNRNCFWHYSVPFTKRLLFHVYSLDLGSDVHCTGDFLKFQYDLEMQNDVVYAEFCNSTLPEPFHSPSPKGKIHFKSNEMETHKGFQIGYSVVSGIPNCGGIFTTKNGYIQNVDLTVTNFDEDLHLECDYEIKLGVNYTINLEVLELDIDADSTIEIYTKTLTDLNLFLRLQSTQIPTAPLLTNTNYILIKTHQYYNQKNRFKIKYNSECRAVYRKPEDNIVFNLDNFCYYLIEQPPGNLIIFEIEDHFADQNNTNPDHFYRLIIHDGDSVKAPELEDHVFKSIRKKILIESSTNYLLIQLLKGEFRSVILYGHYKTVDVGCGGIFKNDLGTISFPSNRNNETNYRTNAQCKWVIIAPPQKVIQLTWITFDLEYSTDCSFDYVEIFSNDTSNEGQSLGKFCSNTRPPIMLSTSNILTVVFSSDHSNGGEGFIVSYNFIQKNNVCGGNYFSSIGTLTSPGYPENYPNNRDCIWTITAPPGSQIMLNITDLQLEEVQTATECIYDFLEIRNGGTSASPLIGKYCEKMVIPKIITSHTNKLFIRFITDITTTDRGFKIMWTAAETGCGGILNGPEGSIFSPQYPEAYPKESDCIWKIFVSSGSKIQLYVVDFDLEIHNECEFDFIEIFDGATIDSKLMGKYCTKPPSSINSTSNSMLIRFRSDFSNHGRGFNIQYNIICHNKFINEFSGVIESPNYPNDYPINITCIWEIELSSGNRVNISFLDFNLDDELLLEDSNSSSSSSSSSCTTNYIELLANNNYDDYYSYDDDMELEQHHNPKRLCGIENPGLITSQTNQLKIHFVTDGTMSNSFRIEWKNNGCGGVLKNPTGRIGLEDFPNVNNSMKTMICRWNIIAPIGKTIDVNFTSENMSPTADYLDCLSSGTIIKVYSGIDENSIFMGQYCNLNNIPVTVKSFTNKMYIHATFYRSSMVQFQASYNFTDSVCGGTLTATSHVGRLASPNYPHNFNIHDYCEWLIVTEEIHTIELAFEDIDLVEEANCSTNFIKVYDGPSQAYPILITICGNSTARRNKSNIRVRSTYENMLVEFSSDYHLTSKGFLATYDKTCGGKILAMDSGVIKITNPQTFCKFVIESSVTDSHIILTLMELTTNWIKCGVQPDWTYLEPSEKWLLKIYDGAFKDSPLLTSLCEISSSSTILSTGSILSFDLQHVDQFSAYYTVYDSKCGGTLRFSKGFLGSPGWPKRYLQNLDCSWIIDNDPGTGLKLDFLGFNIPQSENCNLNFLEIREENESGKLLGVFCGTEAPINISTIGAICLIYHTNSESSSNNDLITQINTGFYLKFDIENNNYLTGTSGSIGNRYMRDIYEDRKITYLIRTRPGTVIELKLVKLLPIPFIMEGYCYVNNLKAYDGINENANILLNLCEAKNGATAISTSNIIYIIYKHSIVDSDITFLFEWKQLSKNTKNLTIASNSSDYCHEFHTISLPATNYIVNSPGYPNGYASNLKCEYIFEISPQYHLEFKFIDINIGRFNFHRICTYADVVRIYTKYTKNDDWKILGEHCNNTTPNKAYIGTNLMKVEFKTNNFLNGTGFQGNVYGACGGSLTDTSGIITYDTEDRGTCQWNISVRAGRTIRLTFDHYDDHHQLIRINNTHCENYLIVRNGIFPDSPYLGTGKFCIPNLPQEVLESNSNHLYLKYIGSSSSVKFKIRYTEVSIQCGEDIDLSTDRTFVEITSPNYPNIPNPHTECIWTIRAPTSDILRIDFEERFDIDPEASECTSDYLELRDGGTDLSHLIGKFCTQIPNTKLTSGNILKIKYFTDSDEPRNGFKANISISYCGGTFRSDEHLDSKLMHTNKLNKPCEWYVKAPWNFRIQLENIKFKPENKDIESCDTEELYDEKIHIASVSVTAVNSINVTESAKFCTDGIYSFSTMMNELKIVFTKVSEFDEFSCDIRLIKQSCDLTLTEESGNIISPNYAHRATENIYCYWRIQVPKGRRITFFIDDIEIDTENQLILFYNGFDAGSRIMNEQDFQIGTTFETSDNGAHFIYYQHYQYSGRGFKIKYNSDKPSACLGDFNTTNGVILPVNWEKPYNCLYKHTKKTNEETFVIKVNTRINATKQVINCISASSVIIIQTENANIKTCKSADYTFRTSEYETTLTTRRSLFMQYLNFTIHYETFPCGGIIETTHPNGYIKSPNFPNRPNSSVECVWIIKSHLPDVQIKLNFTTLKLENDCDKNYIEIYNGQTRRDLKIGKYCEKILPNNNVIVTQGSSLLIEYQYEMNLLNDMEQQGFALYYELVYEGCGGIFHRSMSIQMPRNNATHQRTNYKNNQECLWEIQADDGYIIKLDFTGRFFIEDSINCTKDYIEIFDWVSHNNSWISLGRKCGRNLPKTTISSGNQLRILFRSDENITGIGFQANWLWICGGTLHATTEPKYLLSPEVSEYLFATSNNCTYKITSERSTKSISIKIIDLVRNLGLPQCTMSNLTISGFSGFRYQSETFCKQNAQFTGLFSNDITISWHTLRYFNKGRFRFIYKDETCGGNISAPSIIESPSTNLMQTGGARLNGIRYVCDWLITAPNDQVPVLVLHYFNSTYSVGCVIRSLLIYNSFDTIYINRLAELCGKITEESQLIVSNTNRMRIRIKNYRDDNIQFKGEIYFTYGSTVGCGGTVNLTQTTFLRSPNNLPFMDCQWTIIAPNDHKVKMEFMKISLPDKCQHSLKNYTHYCTCSYIDVRDGGSSFSDQITKLCGQYNNTSLASFTSSWNTAYIRLFADVQQNDIFELKLTPEMSSCGASYLTPTNEFKTLTSPNYPNSYPVNLQCTWIIKTSPFSKTIILIDEVDLQGNNDENCETDRLELIEDSNRYIITQGLGSHSIYVGNSINVRNSYKYILCDNATKHTDHYSISTGITVIFRSMYTTMKKGRGFKIRYGLENCNRSINSNQGRIQYSTNSHINARNECLYKITSDPNTTLSVYFALFYFPRSEGCSKSGLEIREKNSSGPLLLSACGSEIPNPVFSNTNELFIRSYNNNNGSRITYKAYDFTFVASNNGISGCGGKIFNYIGLFTSPMYPNIQNTFLGCIWDVTVPVGYKVALTFNAFNIQGPCDDNKVTVITYTKNNNIPINHDFCAGDSPSMLFSDTKLKLKYISSPNNGGTGWSVSFKAEKRID